MKKIIPGISDSDKARLLELLPLEGSYRPAVDTLERLFLYANTVMLDKGDTLIAAGECDASLYIVIDGLLRCWFWNGDKEEIAFFSTIPTVFLNYNSYYAGEPSFYCYDACLPSRIIRIARNDYDNMLATSHDFTRWMLNLADFQAYTLEKKASRDLGSAQEKYDSLMKGFPEIFNMVPLGMIASYLKITPQYLSKIRGKKK